MLWLFYTAAIDSLIYTLFSLKPMSQNWISSSVARMKILINSSIRLGETCCKCSSSNSISKEIRDVLLHLGDHVPEPSRTASV